MSTPPLSPVRWLKAHGWQLLVVLLLALSLALTLRATKSLRGEMRNLRTEMTGLKQETAKLRDDVESRLSGADASSFIETPTGLKPAAASHGISKADLEFLTGFRGPLLAPDALQSALTSGAVQPALQSAVTSSCDKFLQGLQDRSGLTPRQALIACAMLRTNGSIPTYEVRPSIPNNIRDLLAGPSGNCADHTVRLMMVLESLGIKATLISNVTKNLAGHIFVDAYDPQDQQSYLLDSNFNVMIIGHKLPDANFLEPLMSGAIDRVAFSRDAKILPFPVYFRFVDPGETGFMRTPLTPEFINEHRADREAMWRRWLAGDLDQLRDWWVRTPSHRPKSLGEVRRTGISSIPESFDLSEDLFVKLRKAARLNDS